MSSTTIDTVIARPSDQTFSFLDSSIHTFSPRHKKSHISKTYKQASTLFLYRRFPEALSILQSILSPLERKQVEDVSSDEELVSPAPIATTDWSSRIKVWSLYLTLLNAIIELGPEDGKEAFGAKQWKAIRAKVRDGMIWEEVIQNGYGGDEGRVDADVVTNLCDISNVVTLLLAHSPSQATNQHRLETYLAASPTLISGSPDPFLSSHLDTKCIDSSTSITNGTNTPRELASRIKILELYALHVLPHNNEWDYARDFVRMSDILDEERREAFLQALNGLEEESKLEYQHEQELERADERQLEIDQPENLDKSLAQPTSKMTGIEYRPDHQRSNSEHDYGIEESGIIAPVNVLPASTAKPSQPNGVRAGPVTSPRRRETDGIYKRGAAILGTLQRLIFNISHSLSRNPLALLRLVLFVVALILTLSRNDVKNRIRRMTETGWYKIRQTVGMGLKVSYI
ncbi:MAG: hypothetical protein Q9167_004838 [Letrouitia subvulpina]